MNNTSKLAIAAFAGLVGAAIAIPAFSAQQPNPSSTAQSTENANADKHACKGHNACRGLGADGKNACRGQGSCATDGSRPAEATAPVGSEQKSACKGAGSCGAPKTQQDPK